MSGDGGEIEGGGPVPFAALVLFEAALVPLALILGWAVGEPPLAQFAWTEGAPAAGLLAALPLIGLLGLAVRWPIGPLRAIRDYLDRELVPMLQGCGWPDLALISVAAGVGEELLFRGVIQGSLSRAVGPAGGLALTGLLFGLMHPISVAYVVLAGLTGIYLGVVSLATGNLLAVMVAHAVYDFVALMVLMRGQPVADDDTTTW